MEGGWRATMPGRGAHGVFEITVELLDIPAHVIDACQIWSRKQNRIQQRGNKAAAKPLSINEEHSDGESCCMVVGVFDLA